MYIWKVNNFPFSLKGRIERGVYFLQKIALFMLGILLQLIINVVKFLTKNFQSTENLLPIIFGLSILFLFGAIIHIFVSVSAASKRLRDLKRSQWLLLVWLIPIIGGVVGIPLLILKGKYAKESDKD